jgi:hypothetical protein
MAIVLEQIINGLLVGSYYIVLALGLSMIFSLGGVVNLAHGAFYAFGAYLAVEFNRHIGFFGAMLASPAAVALLGIAIERLFLNRLDPAAHPAFHSLAGLRVSSHFLVRRDGELVQFVPWQRRAWHAGASRWRGREHCNDCSLGIELEGTDRSAFDDAQYARLAALLRALRSRTSGPACGAPSSPARSFACPPRPVLRPKSRDRPKPLMPFAPE